MIIEKGESLPAYARFMLLRPNPQELAACLCILGKGFELNSDGLPLKILRKNLLFPYLHGMVEQVCYLTMWIS